MSEDRRTEKEARLSVGYLKAGGRKRVGERKERREV